MTVKAAAGLLLSNDRYLIVTHLNPDGDTIGSAAALCSALRRAGKTAFLYLNPQISEKYTDYYSKDLYADSDFVPSYIIAVDIADPQLFPKCFSGSVWLCIDHHPSNKRYSDNLLLEDNRSSCGEIVYKLIIALGNGVTASEATLLYIALSTDTGCFRFKNTDSASFLAASKYAAAGADIFSVNKLFFNTKSRQRAALEGIVYTEIEYFFNGKFAVASVTLEILSRTGAGDSDLDNLAGIVSCIDGTIITATIREIENCVCKVSLRSDTIDCCGICANFGGGGHRAAAGFTIHATPAQTKSILADIMEGYI